jgi:hypothetical protein
MISLTLAARCGRQAIAWLGLLALGGCVTYSNSFQAVERQLQEAKYDDALKTIEQRAQSKTDRMLYLLDRGMVLRMKRDYAASNAALEAAKQEMERLYAASVSENALSIVINDATVSYSGDDYEQVLVHLYMALNYLELGQPDEARVEALQVDIKLRELAEKFAAGKFTEDALSRYLAGMIYEDAGEWSDAMISYRKAYEAYQKYQEHYHTVLPDMLKHDLVRLAQKLGLKDELRQYRQEFNLPAEKKESATSAAPVGELVFILSNGLAPIKRERISSTWVPIPQEDKKNVVAIRTGKPAQPQPAQTSPPPPIQVTIALPYYESRPARVAMARLRTGDTTAATQLMEDIDGIARASLDARMPAITARTIARAIAKGAIQHAVDKSGNKQDDAGAKLIGSLLVRVAAVVTEHADTRSWLTLPANIQLARLPLPPGLHDIEIDLLGADGQVRRTLKFPQVSIRDGHKTWLTYHVID